MPTRIQVTQEDINDLARKLDEFATVLTEREHAILLGILGLAGKEIEETVNRATQPSQPTPPEPETLPALSAGVRSAFERGVGAKFAIYRAGESEAEAANITGTIGVGVTF